MAPLNAELTAKPAQQSAGQDARLYGRRGRPPLRPLIDSQLDIVLDDSRADGVAGETGDVVDVEFAHQMLPVFVHRFESDAQFRGDLFVGFALGNQLEHFHLARTQPVDSLLELSPSRERLRIATVEAPGDGGAEKCVSFLHLPN